MRNGESEPGQVGAGGQEVCEVHSGEGFLKERHVGKPGEAVKPQREGAVCFYAYMICA